MVRVKLPKIKLQRLDGSPGNCQTFAENFESTLDKNGKLSPI